MANAHAAPVQQIFLNLGKAAQACRLYEEGGYLRFSS